MYYHQINFATQFRFFFISFIAGIVVGFLSLILCSAAYPKRMLVILDCLFCIFTVGVFACINILYLDAAMRVYELFGYMAAIILIRAVISRKIDPHISKIADAFRLHFYCPLKRICKRIINKANLLLKKVHSVLYNFLINFKEHFFRYAKGASEKKQKKKKTKATKAAS